MLEHSAPEMIAGGITVLLGFLVVPLWLATGLADYFCHRSSDIAHTSGTRESALHLLQFALTGIPLIAALFLHVDAALLAFMLLCVLLHHSVAYIDVRYANATRRVTPLEQMVHSFLELLPIAAFLLIAALDFSQLAALFGAGGGDFGIRLRQPALPFWYVGSVLGAAVVVGLVPYLEELVRCLSASKKPQPLWADPVPGPVKRFPKEL